MKIAMAGLGYVGLSNAVLLAQHNEVLAIDTVQEKWRSLRYSPSSVGTRSGDVHSGS